MVLVKIGTGSGKICYVRLSKRKPLKSHTSLDIFKASKNVESLQEDDFIGRKTC